MDASLITAKLLHVGPVAMATEEAPPVFQEAGRCAICDAAFSTFRRRHHCRCCGKSLCNEHSSKQMTLPQFGVHTLVRVCDVCFSIPQLMRSEGKVPDAVVQERARITDSLANLELDPGKRASQSEAIAEVIPEAPSVNCTCGMPLCICKVVADSEVSSISQLAGVQPGVPPLSKKPHSLTRKETAKANSSSSSNNNLPSLFFATAELRNGVLKQYDATGEGMREAIKNGDLAGVRELLGKGVDPNHRDRQGMSLLHLAVVFNFTEIAFALMDAGAMLDAKNAQGETPMDCAQATLQYKMQQKSKFLAK